MTSRDVRQPLRACFTPVPTNFTMQLWLSLDRRLISLWNSSIERASFS